MKNGERVLPFKQTEIFFSFFFGLGIGEVFALAFVCRGREGLQFAVFGENTWGLGKPFAGYSSRPSFAIYTIED